MNLQTVIQKAIEGGWKSPKVFILNNDFWIDRNSVNDMIKGYSEIFLEPLFWQALGKAMGWNNADNYISGFDTLLALSQKKWLIEWHSFINHLAEGKTIESFFEQL